MKRGIFDVLKRGFDNTIANWQIILLRFGETLLMGVLAVITLIAVIVPILVSVGIRVMSIRTPDDVASAIELLASAWMVLVWIFLAVCVLLLIWVAVHSFVQAGCARVYVDAERVAGPEMAGTRTRFEVFSMQRWMAGAADGWWEVFWIYNLAWGLASLFLLLPLIPTAALMLLFHERPAVMITSGCVGLALTLALGIAVGVLTSMWTTRAIADWAVHRSGARDALARAWRANKTDFARHIVVVLAVVAVGIAGSSLFGSFSAFAAFAEAFQRQASFGFVTLPVRIISSLLSSIFSGAIASWYLASYSALSVEDRS